MKYYVLCTVLFFFYLRNVNSLKCYTCVSTASNQTCAQFNKTKIPLLTCNKTTTNVSQFLNTSRLNYNYLNDVNRATDYECVVYKKYYLEEKFFQVGRGCFPKTSYVNSCQALYITPGVKQHDLLECKSCIQDMCNSSGSYLQTPLKCFLFLILGSFIF